MRTVLTIAGSDSGGGAANARPFGPAGVEVSVHAEDADPSSVVLMRTFLFSVCLVVASGCTTEAAPPAVSPAAPKPVAVAAPKPAAAPADPFAIRAGAASCALPTNSTCTEYAAATDAAKAGCDMFKGNWADTGCTRDKVIGACLTKAGDINFIYTGGPMGLTKETANMMCPEAIGQLELAP